MGLQIPALTFVIRVASTIRPQLFLPAKWGYAHCPHGPGSYQDKWQLLLLLFLS